MRHEDIPPANEYERGVLARFRYPHTAPLAPRIGSVLLVRDFLRRLLDLTLPFTRLKISSLDYRIRLDAQRIPGRLNIYPMTLNDERKEKMEEFCHSRGIESFAEHLEFDPWAVQPIVGYVFKGQAPAAAALMTEILTDVYGAKLEDEFRFALM